MVYTQLNILHLFPQIATVLSQCNENILDLRELFEKENLSSQKKYDILDYIFTNFPKLRYLNLNNNNIELLPESLGNLTSLETLVLDNNLLKSLPESLGNLICLESLSLDNNLLESLPEIIGNLNHLTILRVDNNLLESLPQSLGNLTSLNELYLQKNLLTTLPEFILNLTNLTWLYLDNNKLKTLPKTLGKLTSLEELYLQNNFLLALPESMEKLTSLTELGLSNNKLITLPASMFSLSKIKYFTIERNQLTFPSQSLLTIGKEVQERVLTETGLNAIYLKVKDFFYSVFTLPEMKQVQNVLNLSTISKHFYQAIKGASLTASTNINDERDTKRNKLHSEDTQETSSLTSLPADITRKIILEASTVHERNCIDFMKALNKVQTDQSKEPRSNKIKSFLDNLTPKWKEIVELRCKELEKLPRRNLENVNTIAKWEEIIKREEETQKLSNTR